MRHLSRSDSSRLRKCERRGVATVEFAIVAPVLVILLVGVLDVGQLVNVSHTVSSASREGARTAARRSTTDVSAVQSVVSDYLHKSFPSVPPATLDAATKIQVKNGIGSVLPGDLSTITAGDPISVEVTLTFQSVRWLQLQTHFSSEIPKTTTVMRRE